MKSFNLFTRETPWQTVECVSTSAVENYLTIRWKVIDGPRAGEVFHQTVDLRETKPFGEVCNALSVQSRQLRDSSELHGKRCLILTDQRAKPVFSPLPNE